MTALAVLALALAVSEPGAARRNVPPAELTPSFVAPPELFGVAATTHPPAVNFAKWTDVLARYEKERREEAARCRRGDCKVVHWRRFLAQLKGADAMAQLHAVNAYLNRIPYRADIDEYGAEDYWATPRELFARGGDCEDYAIAKYFSLRALGWPAERLRIVVVHDRDRDLVHAALIAYHAGKGYLLDIEISEVTDQSRISRYVPIFSISELGWWSYPPPQNMVTERETAPPVERAPQRRAVAAPVVPLEKADPALRQAQSAPLEEAEAEIERDAEPALEPGERLGGLFEPGAQ